MKTEVERLGQGVKELAVPAGRKVGTPGHARARSWLEEQIANLGLVPFGATHALPYRHGRDEFFNLVAVRPGENRNLPAILIGAHYDSVIAASSADDNASGVAIALEVARRLPPLQRDVVFAFFDAEEPPFFLTPAMGSIRFYEDHGQDRSFHAALILDLVGHDVPLPHPHMARLLPAFGQILFLTGVESSEGWSRLLPGVACEPALPVVATINERVGDLSDHHIFRRNGVPYLFLSCGRWRHYHQPSDTPDKLNYEKMAHIRAFVSRVVEAADRADLAPGAPDTTRFEISQLESALGPSLPVLCAMMGIEKLETKRDLERLAEALQGGMGI